jgi:membrane-associated protease RseP (regulator of RpoE activity)
MGVPPSETSEFRFPTDDTFAASRAPVPLAAEPRPRVWPVRHIVLFLLTLVTTTLAGIGHYEAFESNFAASPQVPVDLWQYYLSRVPSGLWYAGGILAILGTHEFGHYYACRYYRVDASLPYFLPMPLFLTGTLGAFIRIRQPIYTKREIFDIGIAGPIAGFIVAVPVLIAGVLLSRVTPLPPGFEGLELGEPLLFQAVTWFIWGATPDGYSLNMHPLGFAAWFGLLATALNLFPIGQLDGGHIAYAVLGPRSLLVTLGTVLCLILLSFTSSSWIVWTVLTVAMLLAFGPRHPRTMDEDVPLDPARRWLALVAVIIFVLCFTPAPIEPFALVGGQ